VIARECGETRPVSALSRAERAQSCTLLRLKWWLSSSGMLPNLGGKSPQKKVGDGL